MLSCSAAGPQGDASAPGHQAENAADGGRPAGQAAARGPPQPKRANAATADAAGARGRPLEDAAAARAPPGDAQHAARTAEEPPEKPVEPPTPKTFAAVFEGQEGAEISGRRQVRGQGARRAARLARPWQDLPLHGEARRATSRLQGEFTSTGEVRGAGHRAR